MAGVKTLLVPLTDIATDAATLALGILVARRFSAHVEVLSVRPDPASLVPLMGEGMSGAMIEEIIEAAEKETADRAVQARAVFDASQSRDALPEVPDPRKEEGPSIAWREETGREEDVVVRRGRVSDLIVVGRPRSEEDLPSLAAVNAAVMESGRPVMMAPAKAPGGIGTNIAIAWNGSLEATHAVAAAMPFLEQVAVATILVTEDGSDGADLRDHLAWHGVSADIVHLGKGEVGPEVLGQVAARGCDLLVMGAYTHSRLRQLIFGGVTRHILEHAEVPVLLAH